MKHLKNAPGGPAHLRPKGPLPAMDLPFLFLVLCLTLAGLVMLFSASCAVGRYRFDDPYFYIRPQLLFAMVGLCALYTASRVDYHIYHQLAWPVLGLAIVFAGGGAGHAGI